MKTLTLILTLVLLSGCGARGFTKPQASYQEFYTDLQYCMGRTQQPYETIRLGGSTVLQNGYYNYARVNNTAGAQLAAASFIYQINRNRGNRNNCMRFLNWEIRRGPEVFHP